MMQSDEDHSGCHCDGVVRRLVHVWNVLLQTAHELAENLVLTKSILLWKGVLAIFGTVRHNPVAVTLGG